MPSRSLSYSKIMPTVDRTTSLLENIPDDLFY